MGFSDVIMNNSGRYHTGKTAPVFYNSGFTLLELLISMTILAMIVVIMTGAFRVGIRAWEKGEEDVAGRQRQRVVLDLIKHQLSSLCAADIRDKDGHLLRFRGDPESMEFVSYIPLAPAGLTGPAYVQYIVEHNAGDDKVRLAFFEKSAVLPDKTAGDNEPDEADFFELIAGVESILFEYWKSRPGEKESPWQEGWDPEREHGVPQAIRITLKESDEKPPIYVIAAAGS